jgi:hypothetical protein
MDSNKERGKNIMSKELKREDVMKAIFDGAKLKKGDIVKTRFGETAKILKIEEPSGYRNWVYVTLDNPIRITDYTTDKPEINNRLIIENLYCILAE